LASSAGDQVRAFFRRHHRVVCVAGGALFALLMWLTGGSDLRAVPVLLALLLGVGFGAGLWLGWRSSVARRG
jgi:hypothetical protein